jgi:hypothetical protein
MVESINVVSFDEKFFHNLITATTEESEFIEHSREEKGLLG